MALREKSGIKTGRWCSCVFALAMLYGCAGQPEQADDNGTYIGWYCSGEGSDNQNWQCHKRRMRNGRPVDDVIYDNGKDDAARLAKQQASTENKPDKTGAEIVAVTQTDSGDKPWQDQLPTMSSVAPAPEPKQQISSAPASRDNHPAPEPEPAFDTWADEALYDRQGESAKSPAILASEPSRSPRQHAPVKEPGKPTAVQQAAVNTETAAAGYTVQLGAFSTIEALEKFVAEQQLAALPTLQHHVMSKGKRFYVLTYGRFSSRVEATESWLSLTGPYSGLEIWVRTLASLEAARVDSGN